jgi:TRAP transporter TAXI family solute receptor
LHHVSGRRRHGALGWVLAAVVLSFSLPAAAQFVRGQAYPTTRKPLPLIPDAQVVPPTSVLGIISGGLSGTYIRIATDIASVFGERVPQLRILPIVGKGSLQNISDVMNIRDVDIGIVQSDVLSFLRQKASLAGIETNISYIAKLYDEEVHVLAREEIGNVSDLAGKSVSVDAKGSGTALTASVIFDSLGVKPTIVNDDPETALAELRSGKIDALVYVTGKPARLFLDAGNSGLHLLALPLNSALLQTYLPSRFEHSDYPGLVPEGGSVETVAVGAVMSVYNWTPGTERYDRLTRFVDAFFDNLAALQQPPHHPKWKQVSITAQVPGWTRFRGAQLWLQRHASPGQPATVAKP